MNLQDFFDRNPRLDLNNQILRRVLIGEELNMFDQQYQSNLYEFLQ